ncbi:uncharacterized protein V1510DRAFT_422736 [Dipodascopsis tothii]|uniref:uncharacterized protein n=1 Tax=Dipodascopsis tothii TaxID=44089 RepID=UPI0034CD2BF9
MALEQAMNISKDEIALYDRQIRLWGLEAQERMRSSNILIVHMSAVSDEVSKNIALAGVGSITVLDDSIVLPEHLSVHCYLQDDDVSRPIAQAMASYLKALNPRVSIIPDVEPIEEKPDTYFANFDVIVAADIDIDIMIDLNNKCRDFGKAFYGTQSFGLFGYVFADLNEYTYSIEREKANVATKPGPETSTRSIVSVNVKRDGTQVKEVVTKIEKYKPLDVVLKHPIDLSVHLKPRQLLKVSPVLPTFYAMRGLKKALFENNLTREHIQEVCTNCARALGLPAGIITPSYVSNVKLGFNTELSAVASVLGGVLGQNILNYLARREQPIQNIAIFDGSSFTAPIYCI